MPVPPDHEPVQEQPRSAADAVHGYPHGRVPRAIREEQVLAVAEQLFAERGYQHASMDELAVRAGVSKPVIYDLVGSKEALYLRCVQRAGQALAEVVSAAAMTETGPEQRLRAGAVGFLRFVAERHGGWDLLLTAGPTPGDEPIHRIRAQQTALITGLVRETLASLPIELESWRIEAMAVAINGSFEHLAYWWRENPQIDADDLVGWITGLLLPGIQALAGLPPAAP